MGKPDAMQEQVGAATERGNARKQDAATGVERALVGFLVAWELCEGSSDIEHTPWELPTWSAEGKE